MGLGAPLTTLGFMAIESLHLLSGVSRRLDGLLPRSLKSHLGDHLVLDLLNLERRLCSDGGDWCSGGRSRAPFAPCRIMDHLKVHHFCNPNSKLNKLDTRRHQRKRGYLRSRIEAHLNQPLLALMALISDRVSMPKKSSRAPTDSLRDHWDDNPPLEVKGPKMKKR
ncbi:hypothetical protein B296_00003667 [Ensete ventricosum]|uniref:Uncharacterized protein n=1 Tax=Ensete ventricosum TaxID=4639 RepID=A0A427BA24_ENSVE|nr:hypothetical protein B296_00003667 [Ensete ventricosum]